MNSPTEQILLRAYLQSADRMPLAPTFERLVRAARHEGLAGATTLKGILGLGRGGKIRHSTWSIVDHLPVIVEIVDQPDRIVEFVERSLGKLIGEGLVTLERASVLMYRNRRAAEPIRLSLGSLVQPLSTIPQIRASENMKINQQGVLLRIFIGESDKFEGKPLYEAIVDKAREIGLAGATVLRGSQGFGANSVVHRASLLEMSTDLPIVVEIVDAADKVQTLLPALETLVQEGMITMEYVVILMYRHGDKAKA